MTPGLLVAVSVAGGIGAVARFLVDGLITRLVAGRHPWGTFVVNLSGSFALGLAAGLVGRQVLDADAFAVVGTGLLGGYTTFSTAMWETLLLVRDRRWGASVIHALGMLVGGVLAAALGLALAGV